MCMCTVLEYQVPGTCTQYIEGLVKHYLVPGTTVPLVQLYRVF
jgi:hypothetical protein